ncbi:MAG: DegV family protein [Candidatus Nanopelagicales bacterium]
MSTKVAVVTDSTSYLPRGWAAEFGIVVVPVQVIVAGRPLDETDDDQAQQVTDALTSLQPVSTSRPSPERFLQAFRAAQAAGATEIVVATLSSAMSATYESALLAARDATIAVTVIDSGTIAMGLGFAVTRGATAARAGASAAEVAGIIENSARAACVYFYVDTLEYLRRGGRVSSAKAAMGHALQVKPLLHVEHGRVEALERLRTSGKALARLAELAITAANGDACDVAVQHLGAPERAAALARQLRTSLPACEVIECPVGGVVGAHVGPGMVAVVVSPKVRT